MVRIIIGNVDCEAQIGEPERLTLNDRIKTSIIAQRLIWLARSDDVVLMPYPIRPEFKEYALDLMGVDFRSIIEVSASHAGDDVKVLTEEVVSGRETVARLQRVTRGRPFTALPYFHERGVCLLVERLGIKDGRTDFFREGGAEKLNSKVYFRRFAEELGIPLAEGTVVLDPSALTRAITRFLPVTDSIIVKQDINAGGEGNRALTLVPKRGPCLGTVETIHVESHGAIEDIAGTLWRTMTGARNRRLVVEVYHDARIVPYSEAEVAVTGEVRLLNHGEQRMEPLWNGFEIPGQHLCAEQRAFFLRHSESLARASARLGFTGKLSCDAVVTQSAGLFFTEINARLGGCTHIHVVAERLLGQDYLKQHCLLTKNHVSTRYHFTDLIRALDREGLGFDKTERRGVVILSEDTARTRSIEYMVVGNNHSEALLLERRLLAAF